MLNQVESPEGLSVYIRSDGSVCCTYGDTADILLYFKGRRGRYSDGRLTTSGGDPWVNRDHQLWCHLMPPQMLEWSKEDD